MFFVQINLAPTLSSVLSFFFFLNIPTNPKSTPTFPTFHKFFLKTAPHFLSTKFLQVEQSKQNSTTEQINCKTYVDILKWIQLHKYWPQLNDAWYSLGNLSTLLFNVLTWWGFVVCSESELIIRNVLWIILRKCMRNGSSIRG